MTDTEDRMIEQARDGSEEAFCEILRLHQARVRGYLHRFLSDRDVVDDLAQETFLTAHRKLDAYDRAAPFALWLLRIAKNKVLTHLRDEGRRRAHEQSAGFEQVLRRLLLGQAQAAEPGMDEDDRRLAALRGCLQKLPGHSSALVSEYYFKNRPTADIARGLRKQPGAVWIALLRVRRALGECIESSLAGSGAAL